MPEMSNLKNKFFWRAVFIEYFATTVFVFIVTTSVTLLGGNQIATVSFAIGLTISLLVEIFGPISGAHINPAVTFGVWVKGDLCPFRGLFYTFAQLSGGITGAALTFAIVPSELRGNLGNLSKLLIVSTGQAFAFEMIFTMLLVFTVLASTSKDNNRGHFGYANALAIGLSITVSHLVTMVYTGSGINPARALGPAAVMASFPGYHWVYWLGPYTGALLAGLFYRFIVVPVEPEGENFHSLYVECPPRM